MIRSTKTNSELIPATIRTLTPGLIPALILGMAFLSACNTGGSPAAERPNVLLIMADDMGFSDLGFMGSGIETSHIDLLAGNGLFFNHFYNTGRCCPTRASLLTGQYAHNTGLGWMTVSNLGHPGYTGDMNEQSITIAQALKPAGYATYMTGKLHTVYDPNMAPDGPKHNWPLQRGFDKYYGHLAGGGGYYHPSTMTYGNERVGVPEDFYLTTAVTDSTVSFLEQHFLERSDDPFFCYVAYYAPHRPLHALPEDVDRYRGQFMDGWDAQRQKRYRNLLERGIIDESWELTPREQRVPAWDSVGEDQKQVWDALMAAYAAQIYRMDLGIGQILEVLDSNRALDNTLIIFLSDNGGCAEPQGKTLSVDEIGRVGEEDPAQSYRINWANVSNTPFREYKHDNHEGGISTPLIVHWPAGMTEAGSGDGSKVGELVKAGGSSEIAEGSEAGAVSEVAGSQKVRLNITSQVGHVIDLMPTILEVTGAAYPETLNGITLNPLQGRSLLPAIKGRSFDREALFFEHHGNRAVIAGEWKLVAKGKKKPPYHRDWELYDLQTDRSEIHNLIDQYPEKADSLAQLWDHWARENQVYPLDGRGWNAKIKSDVNRRD